MFVIASPSSSASSSRNIAGNRCDESAAAAAATCKTPANGQFFAIGRHALLHYCEYGLAIDATQFSLLAVHDDDDHVDENNNNNNNNNDQSKRKKKSPPPPPFEAITCDKSYASLHLVSLCVDAHSCSVLFAVKTEDFGYLLLNLSRDEANDEVALVDAEPSYKLDYETVKSSRHLLYATTNEYFLRSAKKRALFIKNRRTE